MRRRDENTAPTKQSELRRVGVKVNYCHFEKPIGTMLILETKLNFIYCIRFYHWLYLRNYIIICTSAEISKIKKYQILYYRQYTQMRILIHLRLVSTSRLCWCRITKKRRGELNLMKLMKYNTYPESHFAFINIH